MRSGGLSGATSWPAASGSPPYAGDLEGSTVLIVGHGSIGSAVEQRLEPFGVDFLRVARSARPGVHPATALPDLIPEADAVVLLVPLTAATEGMVDADLLRAMKPGGLLVNAGRGRLVDQEALAEALYEGRIRAEQIGRLLDGRPPVNVVTRQKYTRVR